MKPGLASLAEMGQFDTIIDVRSPAEFAEDHVPGAMSCPVLDDTQRAEVGTLYKQVSPFAARRVGGAYVSIAIGQHIATYFNDKPKSWRPLVMCWRGGMRSGSMVTVMRAVGWDAHQLEGGYKAFRRLVMEGTAAQANSLQFRVVAGPTGSGKTQLLRALKAQGAQVLDLEELAAHKGSILGAMQDVVQPSQRAFETAIWQVLDGFDSSRPVFVEAESRKLGCLRIPDPLLEAIRKASVTVISASVAERVAFLLRDYAYWLDDRAALIAQLDHLKALRGGECVAAWQGMVMQGQDAMLIESLLRQHYDPLYLASLSRNYRGRVDAEYEMTDLSDKSIADLAHVLSSLH